MKILNNKGPKIDDSGFRIADSKLKTQKKKYENTISKINNSFKKIKVCVYNSPIIKILFHTNIGPLPRMSFPGKLPNCGLLSFCRFKIRTLTTNRFKNQTNDTLKLLGHKCSTI